MAKHKLYRHIESSTLSALSPLTENSVKNASPTASDGMALVRYGTIKTNSVNANRTNKESINDEGVTNDDTGTALCKYVSGAGTSDSDFDSDEFFKDFPESGPKLPYATAEDEWILKYVLKGQNIYKVGSISLWKHLEAKKEKPKRSYQSLKNRFMRNIKPNLFSRYKYLITDDAEVERILARFPELKSKVGRTNTLSRLQLPTRHPYSRAVEDGFGNGSRENNEKVAPPRTSISSGSSERQPPLNLHNFSNFVRKVKIKNKSVEISVNFRSKKQLNNPVTPSLGIYETYKKLQKKNKLVLCSACGRYNQPKKSNLEDSSAGGKSLKFSAERHVLAANSLGADPGNSGVTNSDSPSPKRRRVGQSQPGPCSPLSPNLLNAASEGNGLRVGSDAPDEAPGTSEARQGSEMSSAVALRQETNLEAADQLRGTDEDLDSTYEDTVSDFKKLIKNEEERLLVKRCLYGNGEVLGISDSLAQMSMESYFVELSPNLETPQLTEDYSDRQSTQSLTLDSQRDSQSSLLARNMMKMLESSETLKKES